MRMPRTCKNTCKNNIRILAGLTFVFNVLILVVVLGVLWTLKKTNHECEQICLPDKLGVQVCDCRASRLQNYLQSVSYIA